MTGFAFSEILIAVFDAHRNGDAERAAFIFDRYLPLIRFENQPIINLAIRKSLLRRRGAIAHGTLRQPFAPIDEGTEAEIDRVLRRVGISDPTQRVVC
jgi:4-hydroxy-tetrahydrodipicolinate synthase